MAGSTGIWIVESDGQLIARCGASDSRGALDLASLRTLIGEAGFGAWALSDEAMATLLQRCESEAGAFDLPIGERRDAEVTVAIATDSMKAWIAVVPARGGLAPTIDSLVQTLARENVVHGLQTDALAQACAANAPMQVVVALGEPATPGQDTRFELLVDDTRDRRPKVDAHGLVDFRELGDIPIVHPGEALMRRHPPTAGVAGCDVFGKPIPARAGKDEPFAATLSGSAPSQNDRDLLCALIVGQPVRTDRGVSVESVLRMKDISLATGNVRFEGTIEVSGDIQPGMTVEASGDIVVSGLVEAATLAAEGSIRVGGGVIAKAIVRAGQSFSARFVEHSEVQAGTTISIDDMAVHSELQARSEVVIGAKSRQRGRLTGGLTRAMLRVSAPTLGAAAGGLTRVQVGVDPVLDARKHELTDLIRQQNGDESKLGLLVKHLQSHGDPHGMLQRARDSWQQSLNALGDSLQELAQLESRLGLAGHARIDVLSGVEGDVDLAIGAAGCHLRRSFGSGSFGLDAKGGVEFTPTSGPAQAVG